MCKRGLHSNAFDKEVSDVKRLYQIYEASICYKAKLVFTYVRNLSLIQALHRDISDFWITVLDASIASATSRNSCKYFM